MPQVFTLKFKDSIETCDFLSSTYKVEDGGFDIGLPQSSIDMVEYRPGFFLPQLKRGAYREATIRFTVISATRAGLITAITKVERICNRILQRQKTFTGQRGELQYAWEGATNITYFEVFAAEFKYPPDVLSTDRMHGFINDKYRITGLELKLYISVGGATSPIGVVPTNEIPLLNPYTGVKATGGVKIQNPGPSQYNYVAIDDVDVPGSLPYITVVHLISDTPYTSWKHIYMGQKVNPQPASLRYDSHLYDYAAGGTEVSNAGASNGNYWKLTYGNTNPWYNPFLEFGWAPEPDTSGTFYSFLAAFDPVPNKLAIAAGIDESGSITWGIRQIGPWVRPYSSDYRTLPLGIIRLPPESPVLADIGNLHSDLRVGLFVSGEGTGGGANIELTIDQMYFLPIEDGLRIWSARSTALTGTMVDDSIRGVRYMLDTGTPGQVYTPFYTLMEPIKLYPGVDQRIYFMSTGIQSCQSERQRTFKVRIFAAPMFAAIAE